MPYPYTLMPDGNTLEPEDGVKPPVETQDESTSTNSPHLDFGNPPPPEPEPEPVVTSVTPVINIVSSNPPPPEQQTSSKPRPATTRPGPALVPPELLDINADSLGSRDQHMAALNSGQSTPDFPLDIGWDPDTSQAELLDICDRLCQQNPQAMTAVMNLIEGADPEDDEQTIQQRVSNHLRIMGMNDAFGHGDWYTTRLDPNVNDTAMRIVDNYFDRLEASNAALIAASASDQEPMFDKPEVSVEATNGEPRQLNYYSLVHARNYIDGWDEAWTTEGDVSDFIIRKLADTYGIQVQEGFADLPIEDQLQEFLEFLYYHRESYYSRTGQYESPYAWYVLEEDYKDFLPLLGLLKPGPLHSPHALVEAFDFVSEEHAVEYLRHHLELVYTDMGYGLPENWAGLQDPVLLANMLYTVLEEIKHKRESDREFDIEFGLDFKFQDAYGLHGSDVNRDLARLAGTHQLPDYSMFFFIVGMLFEPADYGMTFAEMQNDIARGDRLSAFIRGLVGLVPGAWGRLIKKFRSADEITDAFRWFDAADQRVLRVSRQKLPDDILNRGYPEQVVRALKSDETTKPVLYQDRSRRIPEYQLETSKDIGSKLQNDVADFMFQEGYLVEALGTNTSSHRMQVYEDIGYKPKGDPDMVIWQTLPDGTYEPRYFDVYSPTSVSLTTIEGEIRKKARKQGRVVLNLQRTTLGEKALSEVQDKVRKSRHLREVIIINIVGKTADGETLYQIVDIWTFNPSG